MEDYISFKISGLEGYVAEREGFEPSKSYPLHTFQACSFDRSDTSPGGNPDQPHLGTRLGCYRCSLPGLAEFTTVVARGPEWVTIEGGYANGDLAGWVDVLRLFLRAISL
jgi:hypothetical protein